MAATRNVVVVGSGIAGMSAAVAAADAGATVTVLESAARLGGTTAFSGGMIWIPANRWARAEGCDDSPEEGVRYLCALGKGDVDRDVVEAFCRHGPRVTEAVEARSPIRWNTVVGYSDYYAELDGGQPHGRSLEMDSATLGNDVLDRVRPDPFRGGIGSRREKLLGWDAEEVRRRRRDGIEARGRGLVGSLLAAALQMGVTVRTGARVERLVTAGDAVTGVIVGGQEIFGQVIIASGGFERDPGLVRAFLRGPMTAPASPPTHVGDGLRMGMTVGAALGNMSEAWWSPAMGIRGETIDGVPLYHQLMREGAQAGGIVVDSRGRRFADETLNKTDMGRTFQEFDASGVTFPRLPSYLVCDAGRRASFKIGPLQPTDPDPDWLFTASTIEELGATIGVPPRALCETVERYNGFSTHGVDEDFGRGSTVFSKFQTGLSDPRQQLRPLTQPPFYAVRMELGCLGTKGGLKTDAGGRVARADGSGSIPGLYAAGNAAAMPFGSAYPGGGGTIGPAMVFGWLSGEHAATA